MKGTAPIWARRDDDDWLIEAWVVPGAKRERIIGVYGERLKIAVQAPPEGGKANAAVCAMIAAACGGSVHIVSGETQRAKTVRLQGGRIEGLVRA